MVPLFKKAIIGMNQSRLNWICNCICGIRDDVLRNLYIRDKYQYVIPPVTVRCRFAAGLESTKKAVPDIFLPASSEPWHLKQDWGDTNLFSTKQVVAT